MGDVVPINTIPKRESYNYEGQRYILQFEPNAPPNERWSWMVSFTSVYQFFGRAPTIDVAGRQARTKIRQLQKREDASA
jgi:hypothetical protein